jgi:dinuclear metal center YbgI/SA1388 family protein
MPKSKSKKTTDRDQIVTWLDTLLNTKAIKDHSCNGLQVQGSNTVTRVGFAVDASMQAYEAAIDNDCQMLITHHGIIWGGIKSITGSVYNQIQYLMESDLNLYASHLPLDLHAKVGNNIQLAGMIGLEKIKPFGFYDGIQIGYEGVLGSKTERSKLVAALCDMLGTECSVLPFGKEYIQTVGIISGGAGNELTQAIEQGLDCYITGEGTHKNYHAALEACINVIYAGHYHTETTGVRALSKLMKKELGVDTVFLDLPPIIERQSCGDSLDAEQDEE